jgi:hypothetical protein
MKKKMHIKQLGMVVIMGLLLAACASESAEIEAGESAVGFDFSEEEAEADSEEGFEFSEEEAEEDDSGFDISEEEANEVEASVCNVPDYVPCGEFALENTSSSMVCAGVSLGIDNSPPQTVWLTPFGGNDTLDAVTSEGLSGQLTLQAVNDAGNSSFAGPMINNEGISLDFLVQYVAGTGYIISGFTTNQDVPNLGTCTITRDFDGFNVD